MCTKYACTTLTKSLELPTTQCLRELIFVLALNRLVCFLFIQLFCSSLPLSYKDINIVVYTESLEKFFSTCSGRDPKLLQEKELEVCGEYLSPGEAKGAQIVGTWLHF